MTAVFGAAAAIALVGGGATAGATGNGLYTATSAGASLQIGAASNGFTDVESATSSGPTGSSTSRYTAQLTGHPDTATATATSSATLTSAAAGVLELASSAALALVTPGASGQAYTSGFTGGGLDYAQYAFTETRPFVIHFTYDDSQNGSQYGYFGPYLEYQGGSAIGPGQLPTNGSGSFTSQRFAGGYLQIEFYDSVYGSDYLAATAPAVLSSATDYRLGFTISDVPEPATWSLMLVGFGALGARVRAGRAVAA